MIGNPAQFEAIGNRLGFQITEHTEQKLRLHWQGPRFPAFLCLGIALLLLFVSVPILQALHLRGFDGPAGSLWYFPLMNVVLFGIAIFLVTQRRGIEADNRSRRITLRRQSLYRSIVLSASYDEIREIRLGVDEIQSGLAVAGSTAAEKFPVPALRMVLTDGNTVLLDRGSFRRLKETGKLISERAEKPLALDSRLET
ncbi:MAG TPA: hypothetical protein VLA17_12860 [Candidatus Limnocylindria bacterium]|nr:hypothetical protein [Candidatus Limnocylindria bacterium]